MDTNARHALKKDKFALATASGLDWVSDHRSNVIRWVGAAVVVAAVAVTSLVVWQMRSSAAENALGVEIGRAHV